MFKAHELLMLVKVREGGYLFFCVARLVILDVTYFYPSLILDGIFCLHSQLGLGGASTRRCDLSGACILLALVLSDEVHHWSTKAVVSVDLGRLLLTCFMLSIMHCNNLVSYKLII